MDIYHDGHRLPTDEPQDNFEPDWEHEGHQRCKICGRFSGNLTCGEEWGIDRLCAECADKLAWEEELDWLEEPDDEIPY